MAHNEIRHLTDELESAHLTQRAYEPELQAAQQEVEQFRQEVQKLKKYDMVELRKAKELNDRLDLEIRALRSRVRTLDAEKSSLQQTVASLQREVERQQSALQEQQQQLLTVQVEANQANELAKSQATEVIQSNEICRDLQSKLSAQSRCLLEKESEIHSLKQQLDISHNDLDNPIATTCSKESNLQDQKVWKQKESDSQHCQNTHCHLKYDKELQTQLQLPQIKENTLPKEYPHYQKGVKTLLTTQECEKLKKEICETLKCLDKERSKYHEMKEKHKAKLCRVKQKCDDETTWRDKKIKTLERELSFCSHSVAKEKELTISITVENEKLLVERRRLLQQLNEEEHNKKDKLIGKYSEQADSRDLLPSLFHLWASVSICRDGLPESYIPCGKLRPLSSPGRPQQLINHYPPRMDDGDLKILEKFLFMMYDRSSEAGGVDEARLDLFAKKQRPYEAIPPTQAALLLH
ncbi:hypothetical protein FQN60_009435, partial [Etheostoma spectabile]